MHLLLKFELCLVVCTVSIRQLSSRFVLIFHGLDDDFDQFWRVVLSRRCDGKKGILRVLKLKITMLNAVKQKDWALPSKAWVVSERIRVQ